MNKYNQSTSILRRFQSTKQQKQICYTFSKSTRFNYLKKIKIPQNKDQQPFEEQKQQENQKLKREIKIVLNRCFRQQNFPQSKQIYVPRQEQSTHEKCKIDPQIEKLSLPKSARSSKYSSRRVNTESQNQQRSKQIKNYSSTPHIVDFSKLKAPTTKIKAFLSTSPSKNIDNKAIVMTTTPRTAPSASPNITISASYTRKR